MRYRYISALLASTSFLCFGHVATESPIEQQQQASPSKIELWSDETLLRKIADLNQLLADALGNMTDARVVARNHFGRSSSSSTTRTTTIPSNVEQYHQDTAREKEEEEEANTTPTTTSIDEIESLLPPRDPNDVAANAFGSLSVTAGRAASLHTLIHLVLSAGSEYMKGMVRFLLSNIASTGGGGMGQGQQQFFTSDNRATSSDPSGSDEEAMSLVLRLLTLKLWPQISADVSASVRFVPAVNVPVNSCGRWAEDMMRLGLPLLMFTSQAGVLRETLQGAKLMMEQQLQQQQQYEGGDSGSENVHGFQQQQQQQQQQEYYPYYLSPRDIPSLCTSSWFTEKVGPLLFRIGAWTALQEGTEESSSNSGGDSNMKKRRRSKYIPTTADVISTIYGTCADPTGGLLPPPPPKTVPFDAKVYRTIATGSSSSNGSTPSANTNASSSSIHLQNGRIGYIHGLTCKLAGSSADTIFSSSSSSLDGLLLPSECSPLWLPEDDEAGQAIKVGATGTSSSSFPASPLSVWPSISPAHLHMNTSGPVSRTALDASGVGFVGESFEIVMENNLPIESMQQQQQEHSTDDEADSEKSQ